MFIEKLKSKYKTNEPILIKEILDDFKEYSRNYVFKLIKIAEEKKELINFCYGVYYLPTKTILGLSTISVDDVIRKKYLNNNIDNYGVYSGLKLQNIFNISTQMPNTLEIVTNNETMRKREIVINNRKIILRKSKVPINNENVKEYMLLQLMTEVGDSLYEEAKKRIQRYIKENDVNYKKTISLASYFPSKTMKNLIISEVFDDIA